MRTVIEIAAALGLIGSTSAQDLPANITTAPGNNSSSIGLMATSDWVCGRVSDGYRGWYYNTKDNGPHDCLKESGVKMKWHMLNAYRSGGVEGVHWKYTNDVNDPDCLPAGWKHYGNDGVTLAKTVSGCTTMTRDTKRWYGMPVSRTGGTEGKQWVFCECAWDDKSIIFEEFSYNWRILHSTSSINS